MPGEKPALTDAVLPEPDGSGAGAGTGLMLPGLEPWAFFCWASRRLSLALRRVTRWDAAVAWTMRRLHVSVCQWPWHASWTRAWARFAARRAALRSARVERTF